MKSANERRSSWPLIAGIALGVLALTAGPALAALTFSGTSISGDGAVVIDSSSTISIGTSTATGITIGNGSATLLTSIGLSTPSAPVIITSGTGGAATWGYKVWACNLVGCTDASPEGTTSAGNATLSSSNFNVITPVPEAGAADYAFFRTTAGTSPSTTGFIGVTTGVALNDTGLAADQFNTDPTQYPNLTQGIAANAGTGQIHFGPPETSLTTALWYYIATPVTMLVTALNKPAISAESGGVNALGMSASGEGTGDVNGLSIDATAEGNGDTAQAIDLRSWAQGAITATNLQGIYVEGCGLLSGALPPTNCQGIKIGDQTIGVNNWAIKTGLGKVELGDVLQVDPTTFSGLPTCNSSNEGTQRPITNSATSTIGATISGGGSFHVLAYCDGTNWTVMAK